MRIAPGPTDMTVLIEDLRAVLTTAKGCVSVDAQHARCENVARETVSVDAGDLDDVVGASPGIATMRRGALGVDHLTGADRADSLFAGGGGRDVPVGLGADDVLGGSDVASISLGSGNDVVDATKARTATRRRRAEIASACGPGRDQIEARELRRVDRLAGDCQLFTAVEHRTDDLVADNDVLALPRAGNRLRRGWRRPPDRGRRRRTGCTAAVAKTRRPAAPAEISSSAVRAMTRSSAVSASIPCSARLATT